MMASEVPMQSCMRTSSGTPTTRNTSNSTGTMTAPPPIPNRPASMPVMMPADTTAATSQITSFTGMLMKRAPGWQGGAVSGPQRRIVAGIHRLCEKPFFIVGPELADGPVGLDRRVDEPPILVLAAADEHVADDIAETVEMERSA